MKSREIRGTKSTLSEFLSDFEDYRLRRRNKEIETPEEREARIRAEKLVNAIIGMPDIPVN